MQCLLSFFLTKIRNTTRWTGAFPSHFTRKIPVFALNSTHGRHTCISNLASSVCSGSTDQRPIIFLTMHFYFSTILQYGYKMPVHQMLLLYFKNPTRIFSSGLYALSLELRSLSLLNSNQSCVSRSLKQALRFMVHQRERKNYTCSFLLRLHLRLRTTTTSDHFRSTLFVHILQKK